MRIVIAASIYPPEVGGPSFYAASLAEALKRQGHTVVVVTYGTLKFYPSGVRHVLYAIKLFPKTIGADAIITFDTLSGGLPAAAVHMFTRTPLIVRIGGDFVWESYIERTHDLIPLPEFYKYKDRWNLKERIAYAIARFVLRSAHVVFSSVWQKDIWRDVYTLRDKRVTIIENAIEAKLDPIAPSRKNFILYSRQIVLKNIPAFMHAFARAKEILPDIELEHGIVSHEQLIEHMRDCYAAVLPSISEVTPNYIIDALRFGKPFLLTKHSGYAERFGKYGILIDPLDEDDMVRGVTRLADSAVYEELSARISEFNTIHTYDEIASEFAAILKP